MAHDTAATGPAPDAGWRVVRIDHVGIAVGDIEAAVRFHTDVLGLVEIHRESNAEQAVIEVMLAAPGDASGAQVQLLAPAGPQSPIARFLDRRGPGIQQLAYTVDDVAAAGAALRARGLRVLYDEPRRGTAGSLVNFIHPADAGGVLVELVQTSPRR
ncbi:MAG: methylmalonyl-CoA epimerase [Mycobacteriales bacterium]